RQERPGRKGWSDGLKALTPQRSGIANRRSIANLHRVRPWLRRKSVIFGKDIPNMRLSLVKSQLKRLISNMNYRACSVGCSDCHSISPERFISRHCLKPPEFKSLGTPQPSV